MTPALLSRIAVLFDAWSANLWLACWQSGLMVLAIWATVRLLPSMPARCQCWLWRLAMLKFVVALLVPTLVNVPLLPAPVVSIGTCVEGRLAVVAAAPLRKPDQVHAVPVELSPFPSLPTILRCFWLLGIGYCLLRLLLAWDSARRLKQGGHTIVAGPLSVQLRAESGLLGLRRLPLLMEVRGGGSPMLFGTLWPTIVMPAETCQRLSSKERAMVLGHELAHIRRGDLSWSLIASLVRALFFFHPLAWLCERQLKLAQEIAADELAIAKQKHDPVGYGNLLISVVGKLGVQMGCRPLVSTISLETAGPVHSLKRRLAAMSHIGRTSRRVVVCSGILLGAVVLLGLVPWRLVAAEARDKAIQLPHFHQAQISTRGGEVRFSAPTLSRDSREGQRFYQAHIRVSESKKDQPDLQFSAPTLSYASGQGAFTSSLFQNNKTRLWVVTLSAPDEGKPEKHTMQITLLSNPGGKELKKNGQEELVKMLYKTFLTASRCEVSKKEGTHVAMPDGYATIQCDADATADTYGPQRIPECVLWRSPEVTFASGATGKIVMTRNDGSRFTIEVTVSPSNELTHVAADPNRNGSQQLLSVPADKLTLADYEAISNPKFPFFGQRPYRMDAKSYGLVVTQDAKWHTHVAGVNKRTGQWQWLEMPETNEILYEPIAGDDVAAFILHGNPLSQLVVYNGRLNKWSVFPLQGRVIDAVPCVGDRMVCYQLADRVIAYSAARDAWGMLLTEATPAVGDDAVFVDTANGRYEFPDKSDTWAAVKSPTTTSR